MILYAIPVLIQIVLIPLWYKMSYQYVDASTISIAVCILTPIYLLIVNLILKGYQHGIIKVHLIMLAIIILGVIFSMIGWSEFDMDKILHPDGLTDGFNKFFLQFGGIMTVVSVIISYVVKLVKIISQKIFGKRGGFNICLSFLSK